MAAYVSPDTFVESTTVPVTAAQLNVLKTDLDHLFARGQLLTANATANPFAVTSSANADITGATTTFTMADDGIVEVVMDWDIDYLSTNAFFNGFLNVDGVDMGKAVVFNFTANVRIPLSKTLLVSLTAGSHTIKLRANRSGTGTLNVNANNTGIVVARIV